MEELLNLSLVKAPVMIAGLLATTLAWIGIWALVTRVPGGKRIRWSARGLVLGWLFAVIGYFVLWYVDDVQHTFGVALPPDTKSGVTVAFVGLGFAVNALLPVSLWHREGPRSRIRWWHRVLVVVAVVPGLLLGALIVNRSYGYYQTLRDVVAPSTSRFDVELPDTTVAEAAAPSLADWQAPADMPAAGTVGNVTIPGTVSGFPARPAVVYLPPAALTKNPPRLPLVIALSGQPGEPKDMLDAGHLQEIADAYASAHRGLAPVILAPDQLSAPGINPMCADARFGRSETYIMTDVLAWAKANLPITADDRRSTGLVGFSQGGTCTYELGLRHPEVFGTIVPISGETAPSLGTEEATVRDGFGGDRAVYESYIPTTIMQRHGPYDDLTILAAAGQNDQLFTNNMMTIANAARQVGIEVTTSLSPGTNHDFNTVIWALTLYLPVMAERMGIPGA